MKLEGRKADDGRGPYKWRPVIRTAEGLALGGIYDRPEPLNPEEISESKARLERAGYEWRHP